MDAPRTILANTNVASVTLTSAATALPGDSAIQNYRVTCTATAYINFGLAAVAATAGAHLLTPGTELLIRVASSATHFAVIRDAADGTVCVQALG